MGNNKKDTAQHDNVTQSQFEALLERLSILDTLQAKLESMEQLLKASNAKVLSLETKVLSLETEVTAKDKTIMELRGKANSLEQYNRKWSIRINDLHLPHADETETKDVMQTVYDKVLLPIFQGAVSSGLLKTIPDCNSVLETAHILPAKSNDRPKPIIARFYSRNILLLHQQQTGGGHQEGLPLPVLRGPHEGDLQPPAGPAEGPQDWTSLDHQRQHQVQTARRRHCQKGCLYLRFS